MGPNPDLTPSPLPGWYLGLVHVGLIIVVYYGLAAGASALLGDVVAGPPGMLLLLAFEQLVVLAGLSLFFAHASGLSLSDVGLTRAGWRPLVVAALAAVALVVIQTPLIEAWASAIRSEEPAWYQDLTARQAPGVLLAVLTVGLAPAIGEELLFRGYLQRRLMPLGPIAAIAIQTALFAAFHMNLYGLPVYLASGLLMGTLRYWSGSVWPCAVVHALNNIAGVAELNQQVSIWDYLGPDGGLGVGIVAAAAAVSLSRARVA